MAKCQSPPPVEKEIARFPLLKFEKNRIVWFTKRTVLFILECGRVGGVCWVVASWCAFTLEKEKKGQIEFEKFVKWLYFKTLLRAVSVDAISFAVKLCSFT